MRSWETSFLTNFNSMTGEFRFLGEQNDVIRSGPREKTVRHAKEKAYLLKTIGKAKDAQSMIDFLQRIEALDDEL